MKRSKFLELSTLTSLGYAVSLSLPRISRSEDEYNYGLCTLLSADYLPDISYQDANLGQDNVISHDFSSVPSLNLAAVVSSPVMAQSGVALVPSIWSLSDSAYGYEDNSPIYLRVSFLDGNQAQQDAVKRFASEWSEYCNIQFDFVRGEDAEITVSFSLKGNYCHLGTGCRNSLSQNDEPSMNLGDVTGLISHSDRGIIMHEFGHALGLIHEHQNPNGGQGKIPWDKEKVYKYYSETHGWDTNKIDFNIFHEYDSNWIRGTRFDPYSIMIYPIPNWLTIGDFEIPFRSDLSPLDKEYIGVLYPRQTSVSQITSRDISVQDSSVYAGYNQELQINWYNWSVYLVSRPEVLAKIDHVRYILHPTFPEPERDVYSGREAGFPIYSSGWAHFIIGIQIFFDNQDPIFIEHNMTPFY